MSNSEPVQTPPRQPIDLLLDGVRALRTWQQETGPLVGDLLRYGGRGETAQQEIRERLQALFDRVERIDQRVGMVVEQLPHIATTANVRALGTEVHARLGAEARTRRPTRDSVAIDTLRAEVDTLRKMLLRMESMLQAQRRGWMARGLQALTDLPRLFREGAR